MTAVVQASAPAVTGLVERGFLARLIRRPMGAIGLGMLVVALLAAIFAAFLAPYDPYVHGHVTIADVYQAPSAAHPLGTDDGALISMTSFGLRHGPPEVLAALARGESVDSSKYYFRTAPRFETSAPKYAFLNRLIAIASGDRRATGPIYTINEIL